MSFTQRLLTKTWPNVRRHLADVEWLMATFINLVDIIYERSFSNYKCDLAHLFSNIETAISMGITFEI